MKEKPVLPNNIDVKAATFDNLPNPPAQHSIEHVLMDIVMITICAVIGGG